MAKFHITFVSLSLVANNRKFDRREFASAVIDTESNPVAARGESAGDWMKGEGVKKQKLAATEYSWECRVLQRE